MAAVKRLPALARRDCRSSIHRRTKTPNRRRLKLSHQQLLTIAHDSRVAPAGQDGLPPQSVFRLELPGKARNGFELASFRRAFASWLAYSSFTSSSRLTVEQPPTP